MRHTDRIQKYLDGEMEEGELKKFREDLQKDPELVQELDLHRSLGEIIVSSDEERFRRKLKAAYKAYKIRTNSNDVAIESPGKLKVARNIFIYVPAFMVLFVGLYFQWFSKESNLSIFNNYLLPYSKESGNRDQIQPAEKNSKFAAALEFYQAKNYSEASRQFNACLAESPDNVEVHFYIGLCYIYLNEFKSAIASFDFVLNSPYNYYQEYANWYNALCYIRTNNNETARALLKEIVSEKGYFSSKAKSILRKLR